MPTSRPTPEASISKTTINKLQGIKWPQSPFSLQLFPPSCIPHSKALVCCPNVQVLNYYTARFLLCYLQDAHLYNDLSRRPSFRSRGRMALWQDRLSFFREP